MDELKPETLLARVLMIGPAKIGKTHWITEAAKAGFRILYLDGDVSKQTIVSAAPQHLANIYYMDCHDSLAQPRFGRIVSHLITEKTAVWNDTEQRLYLRGLKVNPNAEYWEVSLAALDSSWIVVIDSWTALAWSWKRDWAVDEGIDLASLNLGADSRPMYGSTNVTASATLAMIGCLPCHLVVIAQQDEFVKYKNKPGKVKDAQKDQEILWSRMIPVSVSKPHGMQLCKHFSDVLWMDVDAMGRRMVDGSVSGDREGGSRFNGRKLSTEYSFANLVTQMGGSLPASPTEAGIHICKPGEFQSVPGGNKVIDAQAAKANTNTLAGLIKK